MKNILIILFISVLGVTSLAQTQESKLEIWNVPILNETDILNFTKDFEIINRNGNTLEVIVNSQQNHILKMISPEATIKDADMKASVARKLELVQTKNANIYKNYHEVMDFIRTFARANSDIVKLIQYGESNERRPLLALEISGKSQPGVKNILYTAAIHGDELVTVETLTRAISDIMNRYRAADPQAVHLFENHKIYFIPVISPDSFEYMDRYVDFITDPNRAFPWAYGNENQQVKSVSQYMKFYRDYQINASIDFHSAGEMIMYPYSYSRQDHPLKQKYQTIADGLNPNNIYRTGQVSQLLYIARGSSIDYFYDQHSAVAFAIELGKDKVPDAAEVQKITEDVKSFILNFPTQLETVGL